MISSMKNTHGGARLNAGRKSEVIGAKMRQVTVTIDELTERKLRVLGDGNLSKGVRAAAIVGYEKYQRG